MAGQKGPLGQGPLSCRGGLGMQKARGTKGRVEEDLAGGRSKR